MLRTVFGEGPESDGNGRAVIAADCLIPCLAFWRRARGCGRSTGRQGRRHGRFSGVKVCHAVIHARLETVTVAFEGRVPVKELVLVDVVVDTKHGLTGVSL